MKRFQKNVENFTCQNCTRSVEGDGYTNHCPYCLWSKHVDVNPGDRQSTCEGMMRPIDAQVEKGEYIVTHKCEACGHQKRNKTNWRDSFEKLVEVVRSNNAS